MRRLVIALASTALSASAALSQAVKTATPTTAPVSKNPTAVFETTMGNISCELYPGKAPMTVANFIGLATGTKDWTNPYSHAKMHHRPLYDGTIFHRVIPQFMIQGGDPLGNGIGDPGYSFKDEFSDLRFDQPGRLAMANSGPNTNGSQFFITEVATPHLNNRHTIFGQCSPISLVAQIARQPRDPNDKPFHPVKIIHLKILNPGQTLSTAPASKKTSATTSQSSTRKKAAVSPKQ